MTKTIGVTERHGIAKEYIDFPPDGYNYKFVFAKEHMVDKIVSSSAKGFYRCFEEADVDLMEAPIFPAYTKHNWIYTPAEFTGTANFGLFGLPLPRKLRLKMIEQVFKKPNFKKMVFKSHAGLSTLETYAGKVDADVKAKCAVVYPCIQPRSIAPSKPSDALVILFVGDFFRKGGANVVDVFEALQKQYPHIQLKLIGNTQLDTDNQGLLDTYQGKIAKNSSITHQRVSREELVSEIYPQADIFVSPTYQETFGFAILEAMSFGLPVVSTAHFAIPEIIDDGQSGLLIETAQFEFIRDFKGYHISHIPKDFHQYMNEQLYSRLERLIKDQSMRDQLAVNAIKRCQDKFSPQARAEKMKAIYDNALA